MANDGTLFLDEIGDLSIVAQAKLLRVLEEYWFERLGAAIAGLRDFRLISATNRPLDQFVRDGRFREGFVDRAQRVCHPGRRRRTFGRHSRCLHNVSLARYCATHGPARWTPRVSARTRPTKPTAYPWPGNIRELKSTVSRAALSSPGNGHPGDRIREFLKRVGPRRR